MTDEFITEAMIEAGLDVLQDHDRGAWRRRPERHFVCKLFRAMAAAGYRTGDRESFEEFLREARKRHHPQAAETVWRLADEALREEQDQ